MDEAAITIAVYGETLKPKEVTSLLGVEPTSSFEAGHRPGPQSPPIPHGAWFYEIRGSDPLTTEDLATMLFAQLPTDPAVWSTLGRLYRTKVRVALHMEAWNRGFGFSAATLKRIADTGAELDFDIYAYADRDA
jgi:hypothetical protein